MWAILLIAGAGCASIESRPRPTQIETCAQIREKLKARYGIYKALRGSAIMETSEGSVELQLGVSMPHFLRAEVIGPLGVRLGLVQINEEFVYFFLPRESRVYRFPTKELWQDTYRRERFLKLLPFSLLPEFLFQSLLSRVDYSERLKIEECPYLSKENVYQLRLSKELELWMDPESAAPVKMSFYKGTRVYLTVDFSEFSGAGLATLPTKMQAKSFDGASFTFRWVGATRWDNVLPDAFGWQPAASLSIEDY